MEYLGEKKMKHFGEKQDYKFYYEECESILIIENDNQQENIEIICAKNSANRAIKKYRNLFSLITNLC